MAGSSAFRLTRIFAAIGYAIPLVTGFVTGSPGIHIPFAVMQIVQPIVNFPSINIYPTWTSALLFYGPVNAFLYSAVGLLLGALSRFSQ